MIIEPQRIFQFDYIYIDAVFLVGWIVLLLWRKRYSALIFSIVIAPVIYAIDALWWWNSGIREYRIGGITLPHPLGQYAWLKFGADFMMTISFAIFMFAWMWIMFENYHKRNRREMAFFTTCLFGAWLATPHISQLIPLNDVLVQTVRHTNSIAWVVNFTIGYGLLALIYGTHYFKSKDPRKIGYVFMLGVVGALMMELPLLISGIRPTSWPFFLFEAVFLINQGAPYLFLAYDKIFSRNGS